MYAVIETGGKQYRVQPGDFIEIEKVEEGVGSSVKFDQVLFLSKPGETAQVWLGKPLVSGASVEAEVVGQGRGEKIFIVKMKRRKGYRKTQGHRQELTHLLVTSVANGAGETATLPADQKKKILDSFITSLTPKGGRVTPNKTSNETSETKSSPARKTAAKKKPAKAESARA